MDTHVQRDCICVLLDRLDEHLGNELLSRDELVILRTQHLQIVKDVVQLELQKLVADCFKVDQLDERVGEQTEPPGQVPVGVVDADLLFDEV